MILLRHYLLVGLRFSRKHIGSTLLNVVSIAIGLICFLIIGLFILTEISYNSYFENAPNIARISLNILHNQSGENSNMALANNQIIDELKNSYPEIERVTGIDPIKGKVKVVSMGNSFYEEGFAWVDKSYPMIFNHNWISGNPSKALSKPNQIVLTTKLAVKLFGSLNADSQVIEVNGEQFTISGVIEESPYNTTIAYNALLSTDEIKNDWCFVYALFKDGQRIAGFNEKLRMHFEDTIGPILASSGFSGGYDIEKLQMIHLGPNKLFDPPKGSSKNLSILFIIALSIFMISLSNHINLSISQVIVRTREIGIRKSLGAWISHILAQYYIESILLFLFALVFAGVGFLSSIHYLREYKFIGYVPPANLWVAVPTAIIFMILVGSAVTSTYALQKITKNSVAQGVRSSQRGERKVIMEFLIAIQIVALVGLSFAGFVIKDQLNFLNNGDRGFDKDNLMVIDIPTDNNLSSEIIRESLLQLPFISEVSTIGHNSIPSSEPFFDGFQSDSEEGQILPRLFKYIKVDPSYPDILKLKILQGRTFKKDDLDHSSILVNQMVVNKMGWKDPIGQSLSGSEVIGVVNDFSFNGLTRKVEPLVLKLNDESPVQILLKYETLDENNLNLVRKQWNSVLPNQPFEYSLLDEMIFLENKRETILQSLIVFFSIIAGLIACLGFFGLVNVTQEQNTKAQGIKKIFGASNLLLLYESWSRLTILLLISFIVALPLAWIITNQWLSIFPNHIVVDALPFIESILVVMLVGLIAVCYHHIRITKLSPLKILRDE